MFLYLNQILGLRDLKKVDKNATLAQLGMDSIVASIIKHTLEKDFNLITSYSELRKQTFTRYFQNKANAACCTDNIFVSVWNSYKRNSFSLVTHLV